MLVGRESEKREILLALRDAATGKGRLVLIVGDPGIGKTRLAAYVGDSATKHGMRTFWGRCWEGPGAPPFWPWLQILRSVLAHYDLDDFRSILEPVTSYLGTFVPELGARRTKEFVPVDLAQLESEHAQFQMHDSITTLLRHAASRQPLALVLDDLHEADLSSLLLLRFLAREIRDDPILVVGTYRHRELAAAPRVAELLRKLAPEGSHFLLHGLGAEDIRELIVQAYDHVATEPAIAALHGVTEGNPFFLKEVLRVLVASGWLESPDHMAARTLEIPQSVREVIRQRLKPLSSGCRSTLSAAAVIGRDFELACLERSTRLEPAEVLEHLGEAERAGIVEPAAGDFRRYGFSHALIRDTVYADLPLVSRVSLHRRVGIVLEELHGSQSTEHLAELAHHFLEGASAGDELEKAIDYCTRAGDHALASLAFGEAAIQYRSALQALEGRHGYDALRRCRLLLGVGTAQHRSGARADSQVTFLEAARIARDRHSGRDLALAALGLGGWGPTPGAADESLVRILEEALASLDDEEPRLRVRLLARLAAELYWRHSRDRLDELSRSAVDLARSLGDPAILGYALIRRHFCLLRPERDPQRMGIAKEVLELGSQSGDTAVALQGRFLVVVDLLTDGEIAAADREISPLAAVAEATRQTLYLWYVAILRTTRAFLDGRLDEAETLATHCLTVGTRVWREPAIMYYATQLLLARSERGSLSDVEPLLQAAVEQRPPFLPIRCMLLFVQVERADDQRCRADFAALASEIEVTPQDGLWLYSIGLLAEVCARLGDAERAETLYRQLQPFADRNVSAGMGGVCYGSAARPLGLLAMTAGRHRDAAAHFEDALEMNERMGAKSWAARTRFDLARLLIAAPDAGDRARAETLLGASLESANALGMTRLVEEIATLRSYRQELT